MMLPIDGLDMQEKNHSQAYNIKNYKRNVFSHL